jgi:hypothetical protein
MSGLVVPTITFHVQSIGEVQIVANHPYKMTPK